MKAKKILSIITSGLLLTFLLAGCGNSATDNNLKKKTLLRKYGLVP